MVANVQENFNPAPFLNRSAPESGSRGKSRKGAGSTLDQVKLVMGLGNPGAAHERSYHNAGAIVLRALARSAGAEARRAGGSPLVKWEEPKEKHFSFCRLGRRIIIIPTTFMNESGTAARKALRYFRAAPAALLVIHDDSDLPFGTCRLARGRGAAGHRGVTSIIDALGTKDFLRLRIGVRPPEERFRRKAGDFILSPMSAGKTRALRALGTELRNALEAPPVTP